jgi:hypothetical protein
MEAVVGGEVIRMKSPVLLRRGNPVFRGSTTIVHVNTKQQTATVTYNGESRKFDISKMKATTPQMLIEFYKKVLGYKYTWLNDDVILLTKKVKALRRAA